MPPNSGSCRCPRASDYGVPRAALHGVLHPHQGHHRLRRAGSNSNHRIRGVHGQLPHGPFLRAGKMEPHGHQQSHHPAEILPRHGHPHLAGGLPRRQSLLLRKPVLLSPGKRAGRKCPSLQGLHPGRALPLQRLPHLPAHDWQMARHGRHRRYDGGRHAPRPERGALRPLRFPLRQRRVRPADHRHPVRKRRDRGFPDERLFRPHAPPNQNHV